MEIYHNVGNNILTYEFKGEQVWDHTSRQGSKRVSDLDTGGTHDDEQALRCCVKSSSNQERMLI